MIGRIKSLTRKPSSKSGNPRYAVLIEQPRATDSEWLAYTKPDASIGYSIDNPEYAYPALLRFAFDRGAIIGVEVVST